MKKQAVFFLLLSVLLTNVAFALDLGKGISCTVNEIEQNGKFKKANIVKSKIKKSISSQKLKLAELKKNKNKNKTKIAAANQQIAADQNIIKSIDACTKGVLALADFFSTINATYTGSYSASLNPFKLEGDIIFQSSTVGDDVIIDIDFGGSLDQIVPTGKTQIKFSIKGKGFPAKFKVGGTTLGNVSITVTADGSFTLISQNMPNPDFNSVVFNFDGKFLDFGARYEGAFKAGTVSLPGVYILVGGINFTK